jgi:hypothetical protein
MSKPNAGPVFKSEALPMFKFLGVKAKFLIGVALEATPVFKFGVAPEAAPMFKMISGAAPKADVMVVATTAGPSVIKWRRRISFLYNNYMKVRPSYCSLGSYLFAPKATLKAAACLP